MRQERRKEGRNTFCSRHADSHEEAHRFAGNAPISTALFGGFASEDVSGAFGAVDLHSRGMPFIMDGVKGQ
jgi:hypothetical protein